VSKLLRGSIGTYIGSLVSVSDLKVSNMTRYMISGTPLNKSSDLGVGPDVLIGAGISS
jgi:hypothetical protein